jgi:hypothetical protein
MYLPWRPGVRHLCIRVMEERRGCMKCGVFYLEEASLLSRHTKFRGERFRPCRGRGGCLSQQSPVFNPKPVLAGFMVRKVALGQAFL